MKNWYLATYKDSDGQYRTNLVLAETEEQAEKHYEKYEYPSVRIAAEDEVYYYRSRGVREVEL